MSITLLTRADCPACERALADLRPIAQEHGLSVEVVDVDVAAAHDPELRAEFGDRLPVVLLDGDEHSYGHVDGDRLRRDLAGADETGPATRVVEPVRRTPPSL